jgi:TolB-like protein/DNA-binding winged helix-turn-helix (wHTH) protein
MFDATELDCAGRRLFVGGSEVPLEPKAFAVLVLLASHPGRAFDRDEILDAVWGHRHVTPGVLNRVITLIRQALGESAEENRYLHTLHGVGYRFDAVTRSTSTRAGRAVGETSAERETVVLPARNDAQGTDPAASPISLRTASTGHEAGEGAPAIRPRQWRRFAWLGALALCGLIAAGYFLARHAPQSPANALAPTLVVLPLRPVGSASDESVLAEGLSEELITRLARINGLRLISRTSAALAQSGNFDLNQLADRLHVTHALEGSLRQSGQQLRIDLRLVEIPTGHAVGQDYDRALADVFAIRRRSHSQLPTR